MPASADAASCQPRLRDLVEPLAANVYFAPEAQERYKAMDLGYGQSYFISRGACMGQVPGEVIASAFGVFNPVMVKAMVDEGWSKTDAPTILEARQSGRDREPAPHPRRRARRHGAGHRIAAARPATPPSAKTRALYNGLRSLGWPGDPIGDLWRAADLVREHRGDSHNCAFVAARRVGRSRSGC